MPPTGPYPGIVPIDGGWERPWELRIASDEIGGVVCAEWARLNSFIRYLQERNSSMATKGSHPAMPKDPGRKTGGRDGGVSMAQSGGVSKGRPNTGKDPGVRGGDGLKRAWSDQTSKPSVLTDMSAAKKRVR